MTADTLFKALADPTRRKILQVLVKTELGVSELVEVLRLPQSTVSRHLKMLREAALVDARHEGTSATYYPLRGQNGQPAALGDQMIAWISEQEIPSALTTRLDEVLRHRRGESDAYFTRVAHRWDQMRMDYFGPAFHLEALAALLPGHWTVADIGTGTGYLLPILAKTFRKVIAIDPVEAMLQAARRRVTGSGSGGSGGSDGSGSGASGNGGRVDFRMGTATALPIDDASVDLCIASLVLHHEPMPGAAMAEFRRVLRPGGRVLIIEQRAHRLAAFYEAMQDRWWGFAGEELANELTKAGFVDPALRELSTADATMAAADAPDLFVLTGRKPEELNGKLPAAEKARVSRGTSKRMKIDSSLSGDRG
jgi:ArsR family transcriptional regulator